MRHPFDGIIIPADVGEETPVVTPGAASQGFDVRQSRRSFFGRVAAAGAGVLALFAGGRSASAQSNSRQSVGQVTTRALGEEGGPVTTYALGEEGSGTVTTYALGEEGSGPVTTYALGEEGSGRVTTYALGEEGSWPRSRRRSYRYYRPTYPRQRSVGRATTMALGEEGTSW